MARSVVTSRALGKVSEEIGVHGLDEIKANIADQLDRMTGLRAKRVFMRAGLMVVREIRDFIHSITGTLAAGVFAAYGRKDRSNVLVGVSIGARGKAPHGWVVEFGHVLWRGGRRRQGQGHQVGEVEPHPYFRKGVNAAKASAAATIAEGLRNLVAGLE